MRQYDPATAYQERNWYKEHGICPTCRQRDAAIGFVQCPECIERESAYQAKYRERDRNAYNAKRREERQRLKELGICPKCQRNPAAPGMIMCKTCLQKNRQIWKRNYVHVVKPDGICKWCDRPVVDGKKLCSEHYAIMYRRMMNAREHIKDNWFIRTSAVSAGRNRRAHNGEIQNGT